MFEGKKSAQIREILISESAWEEMTCLFAPSLIEYYTIKVGFEENYPNNYLIQGFATCCILFGSEATKVQIIISKNKLF